MNGQNDGALVVVVACIAFTVIGVLIVFAMQTMTREVTDGQRALCEKIGGVKFVEGYRSPDLCLSENGRVLRTWE